MVVGDREAWKTMVRSPAWDTWSKIFRRTLELMCILPKPLGALVFIFPVTVTVGKLSLEDTETSLNWRHSMVSKNICTY